MPWLSRREMARMVRELAEARRGRVAAEERLEIERDRVDRIGMAVMDHAATKAGNYAISARVDNELPRPPENVIDTSDLKSLMADEYKYYVEVARDAGYANPEAEAKDWLKREAAGEPLPFQSQTM